MGIYKLRNLIARYPCSNVTEVEQKHNIYQSKSVYIDIMFKLVDIYHKNKEIVDSISYENLDSILTLYAEQLKNYLTSYQYRNRDLFVFIDLHHVKDLPVKTVYYKDYIPKTSDFSRQELQNSTPMIERKYVKKMVLANSLPNSIEDNIMTAAEKAIAESKERIAKSIALLATITPMITSTTSSAMVTTPTTTPTSSLEKIPAEIDQKLLLDYDVTKVRCFYELTNSDSKYHQVNIDDYVSVYYLKKTLALTPELERKLDCIINHCWYRYLKYRGAKVALKQERKKQNDKNNKNFKAIIFNFPTIIDKMKLDNVEYFACTSESDYALVKHLKTYNKNNYPTVLTNDTDMIALLCDVNCVIKLHVSGKSYTNTVKPITFWRNVFGCDLPANIIKTLCVLRGTGYNTKKFPKRSDLYITEFEDVLSMLKIKKFEDIDETSLKYYIYEFVDKHQTLANRMTILAYNIFLDEEDTLCTISCDKHMLDHIKKNTVIL